MNVVLVVLGAVVGAPVRYLTDRAIQARYGTAFPWGTLTVNVLGSFVLGLITGAVLGGAAPNSVRLLVGVGFCGALTTYSTFGYETLRLFEKGGGRGHAVANVVVSVSAALGAALIGAGLAQAIWP